jgi:hypothetical protein
MSATPNFTAAQIAAEALRHESLIRANIKDIRTAIPVQVMAVHLGEGSPPSIGAVDVQPLVQTVDGSGRLWSLGVTYGAQFSRLQSGSTAIILDPSVGDIGLATVCDRDISSVIASGALAGPGSARTHDISDLVYQFSIVPKAISQYLQATASLLKAVFPAINLNGVTIDSSGDLSAPTLAAGNGASGTVTTETGYTMIFVDGICISIT